MARNDADMTVGSIPRHYLSFALPLMLGLLFQQMYNAVDSVVVGNFVGPEALGAVTSTTSVINMLIGICNGLSLGAGAVISQAYGAKDETRVRKAVHTTITVTLLLCVAATMIGRSLVATALDRMNTPDSMRNEAREYLTIYFSGISGLLLYNMGSAILRAVGDSRRPLFFLIFSAVTNTLLDLLFVLQFHMGVAGVAYATIIAQGLSALLVLFVLGREKGPFGLRARQLGINGEALRQILIIGLPASVQQGLTAFSNVSVQGYINQLGDLAPSGWGSYNRIDAFLMVPVMAIAQASTTFVAQNWGARQPERARKGVSIGLRMAIVCVLVLGSLTLVFAHPLLTLISPDPLVNEYGAKFIRIITPFYICICFNQLYAGALRGVGQSVLPTIIMLLSFVAFRQAYLAVATSLVTTENARLIVVALAYPAGWIMCSSLEAIVYRFCRLFRPLPEAREANAH